MSRVFVYVCLGSVFSLIALFSKGRAQDINTDGCPNTSGIITICLFDPFRNCITQDQCPYGYKCCPYGCGNQCLAVSNSLQHPGSCPARRTSTRVSCLNDITCKANEKCCYRYCVVVRPFSVPVLGPEAEK